MSRDQRQEGLYDPRCDGEMPLRAAIGQVDGVTGLVMSALESDLDLTSEMNNRLVGMRLTAGELALKLASLDNYLGRLMDKPVVPSILDDVEEIDTHETVWLGKSSGTASEQKPDEEHKDVIDTPQPEPTPPTPSPSSEATKPVAPLAKPKNPKPTRTPSKPLTTYQSSSAQSGQRRIEMRAEQIRAGLEGPEAIGRNIHDYLENGGMPPIMPTRASISLAERLVKKTIADPGSSDEKVNRARVLQVHISTAKSIIR